MKVEIIVKYRGKTYSWVDTDKSLELASYMYEDGNYACDCNLSLFIKRNCDKSFKEMDCGEKIELVSIKPKK